MDNILLKQHTTVSCCSSEHDLSSSPRLSYGRHLEHVGCARDQCRDHDAVGGNVRLSRVCKLD